MRLLITSACVVVFTTAPALGCPQRLLCLDERDVAAAAPDAPRRGALAMPVVTRERRRADDVEMPWIWSALRDRAYARMPRYREPQRFTLVLAPVVVSSPSDTVPGVGVAGDF